MAERQTSDTRQGFFSRYLEERRQGKVQGIAEKIVIGAAANKGGGGEMASDMAMGWYALSLVGSEVSDDTPDIDKLNASLENSPFRYRIEGVVPVEAVTDMMRPVFRFLVFIPEREEIQTA